MTNAAFDTASYDDFAEGHFLTRNMMKWYWASYTTDPRERQDVYTSPLQASNERLKGLAPAIIPTLFPTARAQRRRTRRSRPAN